jgi:hypothetical protein
MEANDFISVGEIVSKVATLVNDEGFAEIDRGFYVSVLHDAVTHFAIETKYQTVVLDVYDWNNGSNMLPMFENAFNILEVYAHNVPKSCKTNTCAESYCTCNSAAISPDYAVVHYKRNFKYGQSALATSQIKAGVNNDRVNGNGYFNPQTNGLGSLLYCNLQSGYFHFPADISSYSNLRFVYNGMGAPRGEVPCIPRLLKEGIQDFVQLTILEALKTRNKQYRTDYIDCYNKCHGTGRDVGSFERARLRIMKMDRFKKMGFDNYISGTDRT